MWSLVAEARQGASAMSLLANKKLRDYAKSHHQRWVTMAFQSDAGGYAEQELAVLLEDIPEVVEMFRRLSELSRKAEGVECVGS
jgi:hypothetical protein